MAQASHISRYRPAVIAVTGVAAAFGIWTLYSTFSDQTTKAPLHRSNAVRRTRNSSAELPTVEYSTRPDPLEEPFGSIFIRRGDTVVHHFIFGHNRIQSPADWRELYGGETEHMRALVARLAVQSVLHKCRLMLELGPDQSDRLNDIRRQLANFQFEELAHAIQTNPRDAAQAYRSQFISFGCTDDVDLETLFQAFHDGVDDDQIPAPYAHVDNISDEGPDVLPGHQGEPAQGLKGLLYYIAENKAKRDAYEHRGIQCDGCSESPIRGVRWHCLNCPDVDLCSTCEASSRHQQTHVFVKIKIPLPLLSQKGRTLAFPAWYPGDAHLIHEPIQPELRKRLAEEYRYEEPQIDALYDQFITSASLVFDKGPSSVNVAIDRRAFDSALTTKAWTEHNTPNALFDRMFAFYDRNNRGAILFEDFVSGIAYLRGPRRLQPLKRALQGFDIDSDGYIDRSDFLLLLRAKYDVQRELIASASEIRTAKTSLEGIDVIRSSQPISSIFNDQDMPQGEMRSSGGKQRNAVGDADPLPGTKVVLEENEVPTGSGPLPPNVLPVRSLQQLQRHLSRLDSTLHRSSTALNGDEAGEDGPSNGQEQTGNSIVNDMTAEEAAVLGLGRGGEQQESTVSSARHDALWKFAEMSYNELLDPIFQAKEKLGRNVKETTDERQRWRKEIDHAVEQRDIFEENLRSGAELDPLVAAAANSYDRSSRSWMTHQQENQKQQRDEEVQREIHIQMRDNMLPTDTESLDQFEADIQEQSLEDLLAAAGYSVADESYQTAESSDAPQEAGAADQTLPQNRLSSPSQEASLENNIHSTTQDSDSKLQQKTPEDKQNDIPSTSTTPPSQERLEYLATLDEEEKEIAQRGGAGRLSYDEIEALATSRETRGLIISWLELASF